MIECDDYVRVRKAGHTWYGTVISVPPLFRRDDLFIVRSENGHDIQCWRKEIEKVPILIKEVRKVNDNK